MKHMFGEGTLSIRDCQSANKCLEHRGRERERVWHARKREGRVCEKAELEEREGGRM